MVKPALEDVLYFESATDFRRWLEEHHVSAAEAWLGFRRKGSDLAGLSYAESVDEALCFGWIDGQTYGLGEPGYAIRFTPRRRGSNWSAANIGRAGELAAEGRMTEAGIRHFRARRVPEPGAYTYSTRPSDLPETYANMFRGNESAWRFYAEQRPSYRKSMTWWVVSAKREETRLRRLAALIDESAAGRRIDELNMPKLGTARSA
jgi:uncharacterized protein YdeI (YjbR/CyaY-like superfamily)